MDLATWRHLSDRRITPIEAVKTRIRDCRLRLDVAQPHWKSRSDTSPLGFMAHEARREYFVTLRVALQNAQLSFIYMRDCLCSPGWWKAQAGDISPDGMEQALREYALMVRFYTFHAIAMATEETLRAVVRADPDHFGVSPSAKFAPIYQRVLKLTESSGYQDLFDLMRLTRNTIHTNGVHRPPNRNDTTITFGGRTFVFECGKGLAWMGDDFPEWIAGQLAVAMEAIVGHGIVTQVKYCPRGH